MITNDKNYEQLRLYADQQEQEVEEILQNVHVTHQIEENDMFLSDEEQETFNRIKSRRWLQST